jgi:Tfp pilus assembly protein PilN
MIKINLLGESLAQSAGKKTEKAEIAPVYGEDGSRASFPIAGIICGLLFASIGAIYYISLNSKINTETTRKADLERQKADLQKYIQLEQTFRQQKDALQKKKEVMVGLKVSQQLPVHFLEELANALPDDVWFQEVTQKGKTVSIKGEAASIEAINLFQSHLLQQKTWFQNVNWPAAGKKGAIFEFSLSFDLKTPSA